VFERVGLQVSSDVKASDRGVAHFTSEGEGLENMTASTASTPRRRPVSEVNNPVRIVIADDHEVVRRGVRTVLSHATAPGYDVVAEAADGQAALRAVDRLKPDELILDISMPPDGGLEILERCLGAHPDLAAVVLTMHAELPFVRQALAAGARGYVLKDAGASELLAALRLASLGSTYLPPGMARSLAQPSKTVDTDALDPRERSVLRLIALGHTYAQISGELVMSERTVKNYRGRIAEKLGVTQRHELTRWALEHQLVSPAADSSPR
jgi:DNA-binding NarL/FixJ family response regulator